MKSVFVSSTFRDMQAERDALAHKVIPELNVYAREFGENIRFVDLRWGVNTAELESDEGSKKVLKVCLDEIDNTRPYMIILIGERYGWIPPAEMIKNAAENKEYPLYDYEKSVTELEIEYGALAEKGQLEQCLFYFREPLERMQIPSEAQGAYIEEDERLEEKLYALKEKIKASGALVKSYTCEWSVENSVLIVPQSFCEMIKQDVQNLFERDFEKRRNLSWQECEEISARLFAEQKAAQFSARYPVLESIKNAVCDEANSLYILSGDAGSGKSTMMAKLLSELQENNETFFFSCGNSRASQTGFDMLKQAVHKLERLLGIKEPFGEQKEGEDEVQGEQNAHPKPQEWTEKFSEYAYLYAQTAERPLYLLFDALDQLSKDELVEKFSWLPSSLPNGVTVVVSCLSSFKLPTFYPLQNQSKIEHLSALSNEEIPEIIKSIVSFHGKELSDVVSQAIANLPGCTNPLYISIALQRLLMLDSDDFAEISVGGNDMEAINAFMLNLIASFPDTVQDMSALVIGEAIERVDERFCYYLVTLLAFSRRGLRETDLEDIYSMWRERFNRVELSLFTNYLNNFFLRRDDGRLDFTHRVIREGILGRVYDDEFNTAILEHLKCLYTDDSVRRSEIVWHAYKADDKDFLSDYIDYIKGNMPTAAAIAASELHDIALHNPKWLQELIQYAVLQKESEKIISFINYGFFNSFTRSVVEYEILCKIMEMCVEVSVNRYEKNPSNENEKDLSISYRSLGDAYKVMGRYKDTLAMYEKALQIDERLAEKLNTPKSLQNLVISYGSMGDIYLILGKIDEVLSMYEKSLQIDERLVKAHSTTERLQNLSFSYGKVGDILRINGKTEDALNMYEKSLLINESLAGQLNTQEILRELAVSYSQIGDIYKTSGKTEEVLGLYKKSLGIIERLADELNTPESLRDVSVICLKIGDIYKELGKNENALGEYEKSLKIREHLSEKLNTPESLRDLSSNYYNVGNIYKNLGENEAALSVYEKAIKIQVHLVKELNTPESHRSLSYSYDSVGDIYKALGKNKEALIVYEKSLNVREHLSKVQKTADSHRSLAVSYDVVGDVYKDLSKSENALNMYKKALNIREHLAEEQSTSVSLRNIAISCERVGDCYRVLGKNEEALSAYKKSLERRECVAKEQSTPENLRNIAIACDKVAASYKTLGKNEEALSAYKKSLEIRERLAEEQSTPESLQYMTIIYDRVGDIYKTLKNNEEALKMYEKSLEIRERLVEKQNTPRNLQNLSLSYYKAGGIYETLSQYEDALAMFEKSLRIDERIAKELNTHESLRDLAISYNKQGDIFKILGRYEEALSMYEQSFMMRARLAEELNTADSHRGLSIICDKIGDVCITLGKNEEALSMYEKSLELRKLLVEQQSTPENNRNMSISYERMGNIYKIFNRNEEALMMYEKSLNIREDLVKKINTSGSLKDLSIIYNKIRVVFETLSRHEEAQEMNEKVLAIKERLN